MGGARDILNFGAYIAGKEVVAFPESMPTLPTDGYSVTVTLTSGITIIAPFVLCMTEIAGGTNPLVDIQVYGYFLNQAPLAAGWQRIRTATITGDITNFVAFPTIGASRFQVIVSNAEGAPTAVRLYFRAVSKEAVDVLHTYEGEYRPIAGSGGSVSVTTGSSARIGPLVLDRAYQYFSDQICRVVSGDASVVATLSDPPIQAGPVYQHIPRRASEQYIAFIADVADGTLWYGQFN